jgi:hypothetical protein
MRTTLQWLLVGAALVVVGCGDSEVCGVYNGGNVGVVKPCGTAVVGQGQAVTEPNEPEASE